VLIRSLSSQFSARPFPSPRLEEGVGFLRGWGFLLDVCGGGLGGEWGVWVGGGGLGGGAVLGGVGGGVFWFLGFWGVVGVEVVFCFCGGVWGIVYLGRCGEFVFVLGGGLCGWV